MISKYRNAGQTCVCANRLYVQDGVYDAFVEKLADKSQDHQGRQRLRARRRPRAADRRRRPSTKVEAHVADALAKGAQGAERRQPALGERFFEPTVLAERHLRDAVRARRDLRPGRTGVPLQDRGRSDRAWPTTPSSAWRATSTAATSAASSASPRRSSTAWSASTPASSRRPRCRSAASSSRASGAKGSHHGIDEYVEMKYLCLGDLNK